MHTAQARTLQEWMIQCERVLLNLRRLTNDGALGPEIERQIRAMEPIRHEWKWLSGIGENPRLAPLRAELDVLKAAAKENNGGTGQGAYCIAIGLVEQRIREIEAEGHEEDEQWQPIPQTGARSGSLSPLEPFNLQR